MGPQGGRRKMYNNIRRSVMKVLVYLILTCLLLLLHTPLFEWWCGTGIGHLLGGLKPSTFADAVAMVLLMISCGAISELPERLSNNVTTAFYRGGWEAMSDVGGRRSGLSIGR